jgi:hypothetical protein
VAHSRYLPASCGARRLCDVATRAELLNSLAQANPDEPLDIELADLDKIGLNDLPAEIAIHPVKRRSPQTFVEEDFEIDLFRGEATPIDATIAIQLQPKYWHGALGVHDYLELVRLTVDARSRIKGDVRLVQVIEDENQIGVIVAAAISDERLSMAYESARRLRAEVLEPAEAALTSAEDLMASGSGCRRGPSGTRLSVPAGALLAS